MRRLSIVLALLIGAVAACFGQGTGIVLTNPVCNTTTSTTPTVQWPNNTVMGSFQYIVASSASQIAQISSQSDNNSNGISGPGEFQNTTGGFYTSQLAALNSWSLPNAKATITVPVSPSASTTICALEAIGPYDNDGGVTNWNKQITNTGTANSTQTSSFTTSNNGTILADIKVAVGPITPGSGYTCAVGNGTGGTAGTLGVGCTNATQIIEYKTGTTAGSNPVTASSAHASDSMNMDIANWLTPLAANICSSTSLAHGFSCVQAGVGIVGANGVPIGVGLPFVVSSTADSVVIFAQANTGETYTINDNINAPETACHTSPGSPFSVTSSFAALIYMWVCNGLPSGVTQFWAPCSTAGSTCGANTSPAIWAVEISGGGTGNSWDKDGSAASASAVSAASVSTGSNTTNANDLVIGWFSLDDPTGNALASGLGSGYTLIYCALPGEQGCIEAKSVTSTGTQTATVTWANATEYQAVIGTLKAGSAKPAGQFPRAY
jgi:hypothetical protein